MFSIIPSRKLWPTVKELDVQWLNCRIGSRRSQPHHATARHRRLASAASGARLTFRFARPGAAPFYTQAVADSGGAAEIKIEVDEVRPCPILPSGPGQP